MKSKEGIWLRFDISYREYERRVNKSQGVFSCPWFLSDLNAGFLNSLVSPSQGTQSGSFYDLFIPGLIRAQIFQLSHNFWNKHI